MTRLRGRRSGLEYERREGRIRSTPKLRLNAVPPCPPHVILYHRRAVNVPAGTVKSAVSPILMEAPHMLSPVSRQRTWNLNRGRRVGLHAGPGSSSSSPAAREGGDSTSGSFCIIRGDGRQPIDAEGEGVEVAASSACQFKMTCPFRFNANFLDVLRLRIR